MTHASSIPLIDWSTVRAEIGSVIDIDATARACKAFVRPRGVRNASDLLRLCMVYASGVSFLEGSAWAQASSLAAVSGPALHRRVGNAADWLGLVLSGLMEGSQALPSGAWSGHRLRLVDATTLSHPGADGVSWRLHVRYGLSGGIENVELTDDKGAERLTRFAWGESDIAIADRGCVRPGDLRSVIAAGAHLVVRTGWNALRFLGPDDEPFDLIKTLSAQSEDIASHDIPPSGDFDSKGNHIRKLPG